MGDDDGHPRPEILLVSIATLMFFRNSNARDASLRGYLEPRERAASITISATIRLDSPKPAPTDKKWTDLNPKFVLMQWRDTSGRRHRVPQSHYNP